MAEDQSDSPGYDSSGLLSNRSLVDPPDYQLYHRRWYILASLCILNISNAMIWISFSPIADISAEFYHVDSMSINWLSLCYVIICIPVGVLASLVLDSYGLRTSMIIGAVFNLAGSVVRLLSGLQFASNYSFILVMIGQCSCAIAQPFILFAPTKMAATWFPDNQRAIANTLASMSNPVGIFIANIATPFIVPVGKDALKKFPLMLEVYTGPAVLGTFMTIFGVCSGLPPTPPTASAAETSEPFLEGLNKVLRNKAYWTLFICFGIGMGLFTALSTFFEQILCPRGYSDSFSGFCGGLMVGCGIVGAGLSGLIVDKTKKFEEVAKISFLLSALFCIAFAVLAQYRDIAPYIAISIGCFGFFGFAVYPIVLELGVECTFPVSEGTSGGFLNLAGQVFSVVIILVMSLLTPNLPDSEKVYATCNGSGKANVIPLDFTYSNIGLAALAVAASCSFTLLFNTVYKRMRTEQQVAADKILGYPHAHSIEHNHQINFF